MGYVATFFGGVACAIVCGAVWLAWYFAKDNVA